VHKINKTILYLLMVVLLSSLTQLQEVPSKNLILLVGPPGSGKTTFCEQTILQNLAMDRPIIYMTTEGGSSEAEKALIERGLREIEPGLLNYVDAYSETVGVSLSDRSDTVPADCANLSSIGIAISKLEERIGKKGILLVFDSLVSPYLLAGPEIIRFMRLTLSKFVAGGNAVLACMDEGCGKQEDLGAMMSFSNGVVKMAVEDGLRVLNVVKHPVVKPTRIGVPTDKIGEKKVMDMKLWDQEMIRRSMEAMQSGAQIEVGHYVNVFWPNLAHWSGMFLDPKRFPKMIYEFWFESCTWREMMPMFPWKMRLFLKLFMPKSFSKVKDMKKMLNRFFNRMLLKWRRYGIMEYLEDLSKTDEHYIRIYENRECCGFENVGTTMALLIPAMAAGTCKGLEKEERDWNAVETKCTGLGDPYCEFKIVPGEIDELRASLEKESSVIKRIHDHLMQHLMGFLLEGKPLVERPKLGSDVLMMGEMALPAMARERYRTAMRMGGAKSGKEIGERLIEAGIGEDEAVNRVLHLLEYCKVGKVTADETIRIRDNCESYVLRTYTEKWEEPLCAFTTGLFNGFFSTIKNQHVKETRCLAMGDPYCEWEFR
jgi:predicted hydrocarbon binding protein/archaellum biogenesis ATPase FlaH